MLDKRSKEHVLPIEIYTDGSLKKLGQKMTFGGWAYVVVQDQKEIYYACDCEENTTNQRMELTAIAEALDYINQNRRPSERVIVYSDSAYIINCYLQEWYIKWQCNGWQTSNKNDVANQDLWRRIIPYFDNFWYDFRKVTGHKGNYWNEFCDTLAQNESNKIKERRRKANNV